MLRHGGPSWDSYNGFRDLASIKRRGRWKSDSSLARYEQHALIPKVLSMLPASTLKLATKAPQTLQRVLETCLLAQLPPLPTRAR
eukprot:3465960-Amphidinium_carterae.1